MRRYYLAERLKNRHTSTNRIVLLMPLISVCLAAWLMKDYFTIDSYNWWYMVLFPGMTAFLGAAVGNRDKKMENRTILALPADMKAVWDGKVLYGIRCMGIALLVFLIVTIAVGIGLERAVQQVFRINLSVGEQIFAVVVLFVTSLWQIPFCLLLQQVIGTFPMALLHMGSYSLLAAGVSLHSYFMILPGGIAARLMCIILHILPNGLPARPGSMTFTPELLEWKWLPVGIIAALVWFFLFWIAGRRWFERQAEK